ncbi:C39 family peptidase [Halomonas llamarensis]|uniref:Cysteine peptidase family C39 domain-containing protein n=1 Tax=Halomonas llamarensis TaxID=2945104 RepID=A0ABT0ST33_9GAMM|nr:cysteine peptidase family C39 domain-containing protein [Halomonas llamarensis]MCL7930877.1 cysteine peptidase family C39 domain-containing protein [Halomonas llamarensis]
MTPLLRWFSFKKLLLLYAVIFILLPVSATASDSAYISNAHLRGSIGITSWKSLRDSEVVKQDLDASCGAASVATILNEHYGQSITEEEVLDAMGVLDDENEDGMASFDDLANALTEFGFRGVGYAASFNQLTQLKIPTIVYTKHRKNDHFSVLRGIDDDTVWLADPSLGNRTYSKYQFLDMWETRDDSVLKGKILAIVPLDEGTQSAEDFFTTQPRRQTAQAVKQQAFRAHSP